MAIRVTPEPCGAEPSPFDVMTRAEFEADMEPKIRTRLDADRRKRRKQMFVATACVGVLMFIIRMMIDTMILYHQTKFAIAVSPYIAKGVFVVGLSLLFGAIYLVFRRR